MSFSLPFSRTEFFDLFALYNQATWPAAIFAYPLALIAIAYAWRGGSHAGTMVGAVLALMWGWVGLIYQWLYFSQINPFAKGFATAFVLQALLFGLEANRDGRFDFDRPSGLRRMAGATLIGYATIAYPLIGLLAGEHYPAMPMFGVAPCPLLIFTLGFFIWARRVRWWLWIVPIVWSIVGGSAAVLLAVPQDWALPISALTALAVVLLDRVTTPRTA